MFRKCWKTVLGLTVLVILCLTITQWQASSELGSFLHKEQWHNFVDKRDFFTKNGENNASVIHVAISADEGNICGLIALVNSILSNTEAHVFFHLFTTKELKEHLRLWIARTKLRKMNYVIYTLPLLIDDKEFSLKVKNASVELAPIYLPELLPHLEDKLIYLDSDCIIQDDIGKLYKSKLKLGTYASFSDDCTTVSKRFSSNQVTYGSRLQLLHPLLKGLHIQPSACTFDASVFVADLPMWRKHNTTAQMEYWLNLAKTENFHGSHHEGDTELTVAMLLTFHHRFTVMDPMWNVRHLGLTVGSRYSKQFLKQAKLLHWSGHFKPWGYRSSHIEFWNKYFIPDPVGKYHPNQKLFNRNFNRF